MHVEADHHQAILVWFARPTLSGQTQACIMAKSLQDQSDVYCNITADERHSLTKAVLPTSDQWKDVTSGPKRAHLKVVQ